MDNTPHKSTVLIVDDTPENIDLLLGALGDKYHTRIALNGEKAIKIAESVRPDLILLDIMMPGMDGYQVCRTLKTNSDTQNIPIIFITALGSVEDEERGLRLGAVDYIVKPISPPIVRARVQNHIRLKMKSDLLESLAMLDSMTNIPNRRRFTEALDMEWKRALRSGSSVPMSIIMMDIDHFKAYNDNYGHGAGDACLRLVASNLAAEASFRPADMVARYGGEEFIALLPETDANGAKLIAERFRSCIEALHIPHEHSTASRWVTVSVGFASILPGLDCTAEKLQEEADHKLYKAKASGRNCICGTTA